MLPCTTVPAPKNKPHFDTINSLNVTTNAPHPCCFRTNASRNTGQDLESMTLVRFDGLPFEKKDRLIPTS